jgi:hypothetical protein
MQGLLAHALQLHMDTVQVASTEFCGHVSLGTSPVSLPTECTGLLNRGKKKGSLNLHSESDTKSCICSTVLANLHTWQRNQLQQTLIKMPRIVATHFFTISVLDSDLPRGGRACCGGLLPILWHVEAGAEMDRSKGTLAPVKENKHKYRRTGSYSTGLQISRFLWNPEVLLCPLCPVHSFTPIKYRNIP